jgi:hypothetical protein
LQIFSFVSHCWGQFASIGRNWQIFAGGNVSGKMVAGNGGAVFSLTPALSRWEREKRSQRLGKTKAGFSLSAYEF